MQPYYRDPYYPTQYGPAPGRPRPMSRSGAPYRATESAQPPMKTGAWIGTFILLIIPLVNLICLFVWAFSGKTNPSKKTYARALLILILIELILAAAGVALAIFVFHVDFQALLQPVLDALPIQK